MSRHHDLTLLAAGLETGFWDEHGVPAAWPDDIDEWTPVVDDPPQPEEGEPSF